jgi:toxin ParE1/3/4
VRVFHLSLLAESDLLEIASYTLRTWGGDQAARYINDLADCCQMLADHPEVGRACDEIRSGLRRIERGRHVIFYRRREEGVLVSRILHQRMLPGRQPIDDGDEE